MSRVRFAPPAPTYFHECAAQMAEHRIPNPTFRGSTPCVLAIPSSRNSQVVEGGGLQIRWRKPSLVRLQLPSPSPIAQHVDARGPNQLGVAQQVARVLREHEAVRSIRTTETNRRRALRCGREACPFDPGRGTISCKENHREEAQARTTGLLSRSQVSAARASRRKPA
jgi:hypothetical protein